MSTLVVMFKTANSERVQDAVDYINSLPGSTNPSVPTVTHDIAYSSAGVAGLLVHGKMIHAIAVVYDTDWTGAQLLNLFLPADSEIVFYNDTGNGFDF